MVTDWLEDMTIKKWHNMEIENKFQRQTAIKLQILDLTNGKMNIESDRLMSVESNGKKVVRVNIIGNIVDKYANPEKQFASLTLDDGSGQIRMKGFSDSFTMLSRPNIGDTVYMVGMLKFFNNELYVMPEIINMIDPKWLAVRKLELGITDSPIQHENVAAKNMNNPEELNKEDYVTQQKIEIAPIQTAPIQAATISSPKLTVLNMIKKKSEVDTDDLGPLTNLPLEDIKAAIKDLIVEGEIYESRPGHLCAIN